MELNIQELDYDLNDYYNSELDQQDDLFQEIPENIVPIKVIKKGVQFQEPIKPMNQVIPKKNARMVRPNIPNPRPKISYEDILSNMGMFVSEGKLHLMDNVNLKEHQQQSQQSQQSHQYQENRQQYQENRQQYPENRPANSYIYNKYFKEDIRPQDAIRRPKTKNEYRNMLINDIIQKQRIKQIKSTKLIMPTSNISISSNNSGNLKGLQNILFNFPKR